jgi:DNA replication protein DnaC
MSADEMHERCSQMLQEEASRRVEAEKRQREERRLHHCNSLFRRAACPSRHCSNLDRIDFAQNPNWLAMCDLLVERVALADGFLVPLLGGRGTGKTQLAVSVIHRSCHRGFTCRYIKALDLFRYIRGAYTTRERGKPGESEGQLVELLRGYDLLVDEIHQRGETLFEQNTLINLLDHRYDDRRCTILIANQNMTDFAAAMGDSIVSRIHESGAPLICSWATFRKPDVGTWTRPSKQKRVPSWIETTTRQ